MELLIVLLVSAVHAALASPPQVICTHTNPAVLGADVTLTCEFKAHLDVLQVTWQKKMGKDSQNMVTYSEKYGINIARPFKNLITVLNASSTIFSIRISKLEKEDATCYNCLFNAYPNGAFTGEVWLTDLKSANEVSCTAQGNDLRILLTPPEIQTRQSDQRIKETITGTDEVTVKGQYSDLTINPTCEFRLESEKRKKRSVHVLISGSPNNLAEDADKKFVSTQCKASGTKKFLITWHNEGEPVIREDITNATRNLITVTSTLIYTASSLPDNHGCSITHVPGADPEQAAQSTKEPTWGRVNIEINEQQQSFWIRQIIIISVGALFLLISILLCYKAWKRTEPKTPKKSSKAENGQITPMSSTKNISTVTKCKDSPNSLMENYYGKVTSSLSMNEGTPRKEGTPFNRKNSGESTESSIKKRTNLNSARKTNMNNIDEPLRRALLFKE